MVSLNNKCNYKKHPKLCLRIPSVLKLTNEDSNINTIKRISTPKTKPNLRFRNLPKFISKINKTPHGATILIPSIHMKISDYPDNRLLSSTVIKKESITTQKVTKVLSKKVIKFYINKRTHNEPVRIQVEDMLRANAYNNGNNVKTKIMIISSIGKYRNSFNNLINSNIKIDKTDNRISNEKILLEFIILLLICLFRVCEFRPCLQHGGGSMRED